MEKAGRQRQIHDEERGAIRMNNVAGIDVSKGKSVVSVLRPFGEVVAKPFSVGHTGSELKELADYLKSLDGETRVVMEHTGRYYEPVARFLHEEGIFVSAVNPYKETVLLLDHLSKDTEEELLNSPLFYGTDGWKTFVQEVYYRNHPRSDDFIQKFEDRGNGIPRLIQLEKEVDTQKAVEPIQQWTKWAKKGYPYALLRLGLCRLFGNGVQRDLVRSKQLLERAVTSHYPPAIYILYKMANGEYNPRYTDISEKDKEEYSSLLKIFPIPNEWYHDYLKFGRLLTTK